MARMSWSEHYARTIVALGRCTVAIQMLTDVERYCKDELQSKKTREAYDATLSWARNLHSRLSDSVRSLRAVLEDLERVAERAKEKN
jgi:hypothetical protein